MKHLHTIVGGAVMALVFGGGAAIAVAQSMDPAADPAATTGPAQAQGCRVSIDRTQPADSFRLNRQSLDNGDCVCYVYTGPTTQSAETEARIADVERSRSCDDPAAAPFIADASRIPVTFAAGGAFTVGLIAALNGDDDGNDSPGG